MINKTQRIMFDLMKVSSFNEFDGEKTVKALEEHQDLWNGVVWGRFQYTALLPLRDIAEGYGYNGDTLYALVPKDKAQEFMNLMQTLSPDEVDDMTDGEWERANYGSWGSSVLQNERIIRVWWD